MRARPLAVGVALTAVLAGVWTSAPAMAEDACEPYPVGRCGDYDRERVIFCYHVVGGEMVSATEPATTVHVSDSLEQLYVRTAPTERFVADVMNAPLPFETLYNESNYVEGLQVTPFTCAMFEWWAECDSWMGPYNEFPVGEDIRIA